MFLSLVLIRWGNSFEITMEKSSFKTIVILGCFGLAL
jgi:hypothetical protein